MVGSIGGDRVKPGAPDGWCHNSDLRIIIDEKTLAGNAAKRNIRNIRETDPTKH